MARATFLTGLLMAAAALTVADSAAAQIGSHQRGSQAYIDEGTKLSPEDAARNTVLQYSTCMVKSKRGEVLKALAMFPDFLAKGALNKLATDDCLNNGMMTINPLHFRGGLFTVLYRERFGRGVPVLPEHVVDFSAGSSPPLQPVDDQMIALLEFGDCVVRADPATAHGLVTAKIGSAEEARFFAAIRPRLSSCLYEGQQVTFSKTVLTSLFAEVLYRDATQASAPVSAGKD